MGISETDPFPPFVTCRSQAENCVTIWQRKSKVVLDRRLFMSCMVNRKLLPVWHACLMTSSVFVAAPLANRYGAQNLPLWMRQIASYQQAKSACFALAVTA